jgi:hypothetical protein
MERERDRLQKGRAAGEKSCNGDLMSEEIIKARSGNYGRINIVVPYAVKETMNLWMQKSGLKKSQFFRTALMIGTVKLAEQLGIKENSEGHFSDLAQQPDRR